MHLAGLGAMGLIDEDDDIALGDEILRHVRAEFFDEVALSLVTSSLALRASELVDQGANQPLGRLVQGVDEVGTAARAVDRLVDTVEHLLNLVIEFGAIGSQQHARVRLMLANPLREPYHCERLARALGVPDDAAFALRDPSLRGLDAKVLVWPAYLFHT